MKLIVFTALAMSVFAVDAAVRGRMWFAMAFAVLLGMCLEMLIARLGGGR